MLRERFHCFSRDMGKKKRIFFQFLLDVGRCKGKINLFSFFPTYFFHEPFPFNDFISSNANIKVHTRITNKCNQCAFASSVASNLRQHLKTHDGDKSKKCNQCGLAFFLVGNLKTHQKSHNGEKSNKCNICGSAFLQARDLRRHLKIHSGDN